MLPLGCPVCHISKGVSLPVSIRFRKATAENYENSDPFWLVLGISTNLRLLLFLKGILIIGLS